MRTMFTGLLDSKGKEIYKGDIFEWSLPAGFMTGVSEPIPLNLLFNCREGQLANNFREIAVVERIDRGWVLTGLFDNKGWQSRLDTIFPDGSTRNEHGRVIGDIYNNPELLESEDEATTKT